MLSSKSMLLCFCTLVIGSSAGPVDFIVKCKWDDKACLKSSTQKAISHFAGGIKDVGIPSLDPLKIDDVVFSEGDLKFAFRDMVVTDASKCQVINIERNLDEAFLSLEAECPIVIRGSYTASGKLLSVPINGEGPFEAKLKNIHISVKTPLSLVDGADGQKHWKVGKSQYNYDVVGKADLSLENLFNGDKEKAGPIVAILESSGTELVKTVGKPIVDETINKINKVLKIFTEKVPASDLEL